MKTLIACSLLLLIANSLFLEKDHLNQGNSHAHEYTYSDSTTTSQNNT